MKTLAIIGPAGRKEDAVKLTVKHWNAMCKAAIELVESNTRITSFVSGGAAWADHVAVRLASHYEGRYPLNLWLPAVNQDFQTAQYYHEKFSLVLGRDTWSEIFNAPSLTYHSLGSFKDRNTKVAEAADHFLAITFGDGPNVKDGGTLDTVNKMRKRGVPGHHFDLNTFTLHPVL